MERIRKSKSAKLVIAAIAALSLAGAYDRGMLSTEGDSQLDTPRQLGSENDREFTESGWYALTDEEVHTKINGLQNIDVENLQKLDREKMFSKASDIHSDILVLSENLNVGGDNILESVVDKEVISVLAVSNIEFSTDPADRVSETCFNAWADIGADGSIVRGVLPINES